MTVDIGQQRVEPVAELAGERLGDQVRREPLAQYVAVRVPAQRREADDPGVQPRVADVGRCAAPARRSERRRSRPRRSTAGAESGPRTSPSRRPRARCSSSLRADDLPAVAVGALPDRQRQAVVALLADHPVAHVSQPVELALLEADPLRQPGHRARRGADRLAQRVHGDEPLVDEPEDRAASRSASSAGTSACSSPSPRAGPCVSRSATTAARHVSRRVVGRAGVAPGLPAEAFAEDAELVDRVDDRQVERLG